MTTFLVLFSLGLYLTLKRRNDCINKYILIIAVILIIVSGLRNKAVGSDTYRYILTLQNEDFSWKYIFDNFLSAYINPTNAIKDPAFMVVNKIIAFFTTDQIPYLFIIAIFVISTISYFFKHNIKDKKSLVFAYSLYIILIYSNIPNQIIRQSLAFCLLCFGYLWLKEGKDLRFITIVILASFFHKSVLIAFFYYALTKYPKPKHLILLAPLGFFVVFLFPEYILILTGDISEVYNNYLNSSYYQHNSLPFLVLILIGGLYLLILIASLKNKINFEESRFEIIGCILTFILTPAVRLDPNIFRLISYFAIWYCVYIPVVIGTFGLSNVINWVVYLIFFFRSLSAQEYKFYWQHMDLNDSYVQLIDTKKELKSQNKIYNYIDCIKNIT